MQFILAQILEAQGNKYYAIHYQMNENRIQQRVCSVEGCGDKFLAKGLCRKHYLRKWRYGNESIVKTSRLHFNDLEGIREWIYSHKEIKPSGCWEWSTRQPEVTYRITYVDGESYKLTRLIMFLEKGFDLGSKLFVCHKCDNPSCFNPEHLFLGTAEDNAKDMAKKGRVHINKGEDQWLSVMTEGKVREIRNRSANGEKGIDLAKDFGISQPTASSIITRRSWKHVV